MTSFQYLRFIIVVTTFPYPNSAGKPTSLGSLFECSHKLEGEVFVLNEREIVIKNFYFEGMGRGSAAWFHAMKKGVGGGVHAANESQYFTLPYPNLSCEKVGRSKNYNDEEIHLILPVSIKELWTIGMMCYKTCVNFGHVVVPSDLVVEPAPGDLLVTQACSNPGYPACLDNGGTKMYEDFSNLKIIALFFTMFMI